MFSRGNVQNLHRTVVFSFPLGLPHLSISTHATYLGIHPQRPNSREGTEGPKGVGEVELRGFFLAQTITTIPRFSRVFRSSDQNGRGTKSPTAQCLCVACFSSKKGRILEALRIMDDPAMVSGE